MFSGSRCLESEVNCSSAVTKVFFGLSVSPELKLAPVKTSDKIVKNMWILRQVFTFCVLIITSFCFTQSVHSSVWEYWGAESRRCR